METKINKNTYKNTLSKNGIYKISGKVCDSKFNEFDCEGRLEIIFSKNECNAHNACNDSNHKGVWLIKSSKKITYHGIPVNMNITLVFNPEQIDMNFVEWHTELNGLSDILSKFVPIIGKFSGKMFFEDNCIQTISSMSDNKSTNGDILDSKKNRCLHEVITISDLNEIDNCANKAHVVGSVFQNGEIVSSWNLTIDK